MKFIETCPCGSGHDYSACCAPYHSQAVDAPTAEALMRARYCAYVKHLEPYLRLTWHPQTCPGRLDMDAMPSPQWLGLELKSHRLVDACNASVEFIARYKLNGRACRVHEISRFERSTGRWLYLDGEHPE